MSTLITSSSLKRAAHTLITTHTTRPLAENTALNCMKKASFLLASKTQAAANFLIAKGHAITRHTIPLLAVELAVMSAKLRHRTQGRTALLAAYTARLVVELDCHRGGAPSRRAVDRAVQEGMHVEHTAPIGRGHAVDLIKRTRNLHGLEEVRKMFGATVAELASEHHFFLHAGKREGGNHGL